MPCSNIAPKISIIIPVYNTATYLRACFDSILRQTLHEIEVLVINDASTDESQSIIDEYAKRDSRIRSFIHTKNQYQGAARNTGLDHAKGEYIMFVDSDDRLAECCAFLYKKMKKSNADIIEFGMLKTDDAGHKKVHYFHNKEHSGTQPFVEFLNNRIFGSLCNKVYKASIWKSYRCFPNMYYEDELALFHILPHCSSLLKITNNFYLYHTRLHSTMQSGFTQKHIDSATTLLVEFYQLLTDPLYDPYKEMIFGKLYFYLAMFFKKIFEEKATEIRERDILFQLVQSFDKDTLYRCCLSSFDKSIADAPPKVQKMGELYKYLLKKDLSQQYTTCNEEEFSNVYPALIWVLHRDWVVWLTNNYWSRIGRHIRKYKAGKACKNLAKKLHLYTML